MSSDNTSITTEPFEIFKYISSTMRDCEYCMDSNTENMSDSQSTDICCKGIRCMLFWPLCIVFDILSCPIRGCIHCKNKK